MFSITSLKELPVGESERSNTQPHAEQPKPRKCCCSIHTSVRLINALCGSRAQFAVFTFRASREVLENLPASLSVTFFTWIATRRSAHVHRGIVTIEFERERWTRFSVDTCPSTSYFCRLRVFQNLVSSADLARFLVSSPRKGIRQKVERRRSAGSRFRGGHGQGLFLSAAKLRKHSSSALLGRGYPSRSFRIVMAPHSILAPREE